MTEAPRPQRAKLTKTLVKGLSPGTASFVVWDTEITGLGVRVQPSGRASYILKYRAGKGRNAPIRKPTIAGTTQITVDQARTEARRLLAEVVAGRDPSAERRERSTAPTVADLAAEYVKRHASRKRTGAADQGRLDRNVLPRLGRKKVADVTRRDVEDLHRAMAHAPYEANRTLALVSVMFSLAIHWGWREKNPAGGVKRNDEERRERFLSEAELGRLSDAMRDHPSRTAVNAIRLLMLTGARKGEVLSATWDQFDLDQGVWTKPSAHTKTKRRHRVPLSPPAVQLLQDMQAAGVDVSGHLFPGRKPGTHFYDLRVVWNDLCKKADIRGARVHDLRHTYASILASSGYSLPLIGALLGHTQAATTQRYAHLLDDALREASTRAGERLAGADRGS